MWRTVTLWPPRPAESLWIPPSLYRRTARLGAKSAFSIEHHLQSETNSSAQNTLSTSHPPCIWPLRSTEWGPGRFPYHLLFTFLSSTLITHIKIGGTFITDSWFLLKWSCLLSDFTNTIHNQEWFTAMTKHFHAIFYQTLITILEIQSANFL